MPAAGTIPLFSVCGCATSIRRATALAWRGRRPEPPTLQRPAALLRESAVRPRVRRGAAPRSQCIARSSLHPRRTPHSFGCHSGSDQREPVSVREMMPMARCRLSLRRCRKYEDIFASVFKLNFVGAGRGTAGAATERPRSRGRERLAPYGVRGTAATPRRAHRVRGPRTRELLGLASPPLGKMSDCVQHMPCNMNMHMSMSVSRVRL